MDLFYIIIILKLTRYFKKAKTLSSDLCSLLLNLCLNELKLEIVQIELCVFNNYYWPKIVITKYM